MEVPSRSDAVLGLAWAYLLLAYSVLMAVLLFNGKYGWVRAWAWLTMPGALMGAVLTLLETDRVMKRRREGW